MNIDNYAKLFSLASQNGAKKFLNYIFCEEDSYLIPQIQNSFSSIHQNVELFIQSRDVYFLQDKRNVNHFGTHIYWNKILPKIISDCGFKLNENDYHIIEQKDDKYGYDLSYHQHNDDSYEFLMTSFSFRNRQIKGNHKTIFRDGDGLSMYHRLCRDTHYSYGIESNKGEGTAFIICDSMSSPVIPILAFYFNKMIVLDVSHNFPILVDIPKMVAHCKPETYITLHTEVHFRERNMFNIKV